MYGMSYSHLICCVLAIANGVVIAIYANLCVAARKFILAKKTADAKNELGQFYNLSTLRPEFHNVNRSDFRVRRERLRNERAPRPVDMAILNDNFIAPSQAPPLKEVSEDDDEELDGVWNQDDDSVFS
jgi:hypothetical protein